MRGSSTIRIVLVMVLGGGCGAVEAVKSDAGPEEDVVGAADSARPDVFVPITCGDGVCDPSEGEACDSCPGDCGPCPYCGNGTIEGSEECDDGNTMSGDGCSDSCTLEAPPGAITYRINATVTVVDDPSNLFGGSIGVGQLMTGQYTFDPSIPDTNGAPDVGDYWHYDPGFGMRLDTGGWVFETDPVNIQYLLEFVNRPQDNIVMHSYTNISMPYSGIEIMSWQLDDPTGTALSSDALDPAPPELPLWDQPFGLTLQGNTATGDFWFIRANVDYVGP